MGLIGMNNNMEEIEMMVDLKRKEIWYGGRELWGELRGVGIGDGSVALSMTFWNWEDTAGGSGEDGRKSVALRIWDGVESVEFDGMEALVNWIDKRKEDRKRWGRGMEEDEAIEAVDDISKNAVLTECEMKWIPEDGDVWY